MKSYLFKTENGRGGVMLCDIESLEEAVPYLRDRFDNVIRIEQGRNVWTEEEGFGLFKPIDPKEHAEVAKTE